MVYIWVRATVDWQDEQAFLAQIRPEFKPKVELWNETFTIPFHLFRHELRTIARLNLSRVEDSVCCSWDEIPDGGLVLPVDDDDWFAPDAAKALESSYDQGAGGYYWTSSFLEVPTNLRHELGTIRKRIFPETPGRWICTTNNYALVKGPGTEALSASHVRASEWFESRAERVRWIDRRLSLMNRTLASQTTLRPLKPSIRRSELLRKFRRYRKLYERPTPPDLAWCRPYVAMMSELMDTLEVRKQ